MRQEIDASAVQRADCIVVDDLAVARIESGDLLAAEAQIGFDWNAVHPLCNIVSGIAPGRLSWRQITLFESHGLGLEDLAVASRVLKLARRQGVGIKIPLR